MKQKLLTVAVAAAAAFSMNTMADVTVYGKANVSLNVYDEEDSVKVNSNASRIGVKGSYGISGSTKAVYKLEYAYGADDGANGDFSARNIYAGFAGDWGMFAAGRHDTPLKMAQGKIDRFNDLDLGDISTVLPGENRANNAIWYASPKANGLQGIIALVQGEKSGEKTNANYGDDNSIGDMISASLTYNADSFYAALGYDKDVGFENTIRLVGEYKGEGFKIGALIQQASEALSADNDYAFKGADNDGFILSGQVELATNWTLKGQYGHSETDAKVSGASIEGETDVITLGIDHQLNKKSKLFAYVSDQSTEATAKIAGISTSTDADETTFGIGYEVKF